MNGWKCTHLACKRPSKQLASKQQRPQRQQEHWLCWWRRHAWLHVPYSACPACSGSYRTLILSLGTDRRQRSGILAPWTEHRRACACFPSSRSTMAQGLHPSRSAASVHSVYHTNLQHSYRHPVRLPRGSSTQNKNGAATPGRDQLAAALFIRSARSGSAGRGREAAKALSQVRACGDGWARCLGMDPHPCPLH